MRNKHHRQWYAILIGLLLASLWAGWPAHAQDNPDDDSSLIRGHRAEVVFPAVMRFWIHVDVPLERIAGAQLSAEQDGGLSRTFSLDPAASVFQAFDDSVELTMTWALTDPPLPRAFVPFTYTWTITLTPDEPGDDSATPDPVTITLSDTLTLRDPQAGTWESAGEPPLTLHWTDPDLGGSRMRGELWPVYQAVTEQAGRQPDLRFVIAEPDASLCRVTEDSPAGEPIRVVDSTQDRTQYPCDPADYARVYADTGAQFIQRTRPGYDVLQNQLVAAIVRGAYAPVWADAPPPDWFAAGLAALYRPRADYGDLALVRAAASQDTLLPPGALETAPPADVTYQEQALWQAQSYTRLLFLADRYGVPAVYDLARSPGADDGGFAARLAALTGQDETALWQSFRDWLASDAPDRAIGWTPYAGITPTPSPTPTASPIPPTRTPTRTPTVTPIPTSTYLGAQVATVVRLNVTVTAPRHTATRTPLPPGSLPTRVPAGDPDDDTPSNRAIAGLVALAGGGLLLIGLGVLLTLWRRQT